MKIKKLSVQPIGERDDITKPLLQAAYGGGNTLIQG